jgi:phosphatidylglycerophosphatase A
MVVARAHVISAVRTPSGFIASGFGIGLLPGAPGTWASAATLPLGWAIGSLWGSPGLYAASLVVFLIGILASERMIKRVGVEDPSVIVIDEIAGQLLVLAAVPLAYPAYLLAFIAFRICDVLKPWPASWADRQLGGGFGAMVDDIIAAGYAYAAMLLLSHLNWL